MRFYSYKSVHISRWKNGIGCQARLHLIWEVMISLRCWSISRRMALIRQYFFTGPRQYLMLAR